MFSKNWFLNLDTKLRELGLDSDDKSFDEIRENLSTPRKLSPDEFANCVFYVILAGGFSQKTAKKIHRVLIEKIPENPRIEDLLKIFNNKNKMNSILKVWENRQQYCDKFYTIENTEDKIKYLETLPHIGKITANHLARNLGIDVVKYDIWIQRLGVLYGKNTALYEKIDNGNLNPEIKKLCDDMFEHLCVETRLPRGYIDVVLWKACQNGLIKELKNGCKN